MLITFLLHLSGCTPEEAVELMSQRRPHILLHTKQWEALRQFHQTYVVQDGGGGGGGGEKQDIG